jgi:hypothetical protein
MIKYPEFLAKGWQIGSGPTEATCKTLTARLKGSGMRWDADNAEAVMALEALTQRGAIAPVPRISAEFERSGLGTCPEFLSQGLGTWSRRRYSRGLALSHRTAFSQEWPPPEGPR